MLPEKLKRAALFINTYLPYICIGAISWLTIPATLIPIAFATLTGITGINTMVARKLKNKDYFAYGPVAPVLLGVMLLGLDYSKFLFFWNYLPAVIYASLFCSAFFPPAFGFKPFTMHHSEPKYPKFIAQSDLFRKINLIITHVWSFVFLASTLLSLPVFSVADSFHSIVTIGGPLLLIAFIAIPATKILPGFLQKVLGNNESESPAEKKEMMEMSFESVRELLDNMPMGFSKSKAEGINFILQMHFTGSETIDACLEIKNKKCTVNYGITKSADTTVRADSQLWLDIVNRKVSGEKAFKEGKYSVEGDMNNLLMIEKLFPAPARQATQKRQTTEHNFQYGVLDPRQVKKILVIDGGPRGKKLSKSSFMAMHFCRGAVSAGAEVEYVELKKKNLRGGCLGCYHCWTKNPGVCIQKDDMQELLKKLSESDLVAFVTPLYYFSVSAQLKIFIDRMLPNVLPWMKLKKDQVGHPPRVPFPVGKGWVVFSAAGFPQVSNNFEGVSAIFKILHTHGEGSKNGKGGLLGEFFLPAAEELTMPAFRYRKKLVIETCQKAGSDIVHYGKIEQRHMDTIADPMTEPIDFVDQANNFWEESLANRSYVKTVPQLESVDFIT